MFILEKPQNFKWNKNAWLGKKKEWNWSDFHVYSYKYLFNDLNQTGEKYNILGSGWSIYLHLNQAGV